MPKPTTSHNSAAKSFWQQASNWVRAFESALDFDPGQASIDDLRRQVGDLQVTIRRLEGQLGARKASKP